MKALLPLLLTVAAARAQYSIEWSTADAGGGASSGGNFSLEGTIAQAEAAPTAAGGSFEMKSGYWVIGIIAMPGPLLSAPESPGGGNQLRLYWLLPQPPGTILEQSDDMVNWTAIRQADVEVEHLVPSAQQRGFFRLRTPE